MSMTIGASEAGLAVNAREYKPLFGNRYLNSISSTVNRSDGFNRM